MHYDYCTSQLFSCIVMTWLSPVQINTSFQKIECFHNDTTCYGDFTHTALGQSYSSDGEVVIALCRLQL